MASLLEATLNPYVLSSKDRNILNKLEAEIHAKDIKTVVEKLLNNYPLSAFAKYSHHSASFTDFCNSQPVVLEYIKTRLPAANWPTEAVVSQDKSQTYSLLDHCFSYYLMSLFLTAKKTQVTPGTRARILEDACKKGSYQAFVSKININLLSLYDDSNTTETEKKPTEFEEIIREMVELKRVTADKDQIIKEIIEHADQLGSLYGAIGYIQKGFTLLELASIHKTNKDDRADITKEQSVESFLCAHVLLTKQDPYSLTLISNLTGNVGLPFVFSERLKIKFHDANSIIINCNQLVTRENFSRLQRTATKIVERDLQRLSSSSRPNTL
ncbi:MAG: hypothetical protein P4M14_01390 [Gammaproteobacteria bacterium]|nr:hypothetical protein [Gammaproteobacteria bacterium]